MPETNENPAMQCVVIESEAFHALISRIEALEDLYDMSAQELVQDRLYDNREVMEILQISRVTLQSYRDLGKIGFIQCGRHIRYRWGDIEEFLTKHRKAAS